MYKNDFAEPNNKIIFSVILKGRAFEEQARFNLATRVMSNGVEVIVAGDKTTLPGDPDVKRILPSTIYKPVTLKPSTLSDHMLMVLPQETPDVSLVTINSNFYTLKLSEPIRNENLSDDFYLFNDIS